MRRAVLSLDCSPARQRASARPLSGRREHLSSAAPIGRANSFPAPTNKWIWIGSVHESLISPLRRPVIIVNLKQEASPPAPSGQPIALVLGAADVVVVLPVVSSFASPDSAEEGAGKLSARICTGEQVRSPFGGAGGAQKSSE